MRARAQPLSWAALCALLLPLAAVAQTAGGETDAALPALDAQQRSAVGIVVAHPAVVKLPERIEAIGLVLDATALLADEGAARSAGVAQSAATAELARLQQLYGAGAGASLKMIESARADQARLHAEAAAAAARFALHWEPIAAMPASERKRVLDAVAGGRALLLRADLPGRHSVGVLPRGALIDVDGVRLPGRVLGALRQAADTQSAGLLIEAANAPAGFGPGARVPVTLLTALRPGRFVPRDAVLYGEGGAYVYKQIAGVAGDRKTRYRPVKVTLVLAYEDGWLVDGVDADDNIVVRGAGVLWSLQGLGGQADDDED